MDLEFEAIPARGLHRYVRLVADALGLAGEGWYVQVERPAATVYLPLQDRMARYPGRDVALLWDEEYGWALAVESHSGEDLLVLAYLGNDVLPAPRVVAQFAARIMAGADPGPVTPPRLRRADDVDDLARRLAGYANSVHGDTAEVAAADGLSVRVRHPDAETAVLSVAGEIDMLTVPLLDEWIARTMRALPRLLVIDLSEVRFIGSAGLSALVRAGQLAGEHSELRVVASNQVVLRPLAVTGLTRSIPVWSVLADALATMSTPAGSQQTAS
ncbi:DUF6292 family protein [Actinophytocola sp.]|uniref:DUF6292 family protein n=1 Tax=Actinophytocola sp. TaxID=1872138 RepID=UPI002D7FA32E|nr:DUF6292 family protein [Actinophytocola sp.]HET9139345.1 DUF6292 family protein [Actinophytocola sp.]